MPVDVLAAGASEIVFDVDFSSPSSPEADQAFVDALKRAGGSVVLPAFKQWVTGTEGRRLHVNRPLPQFDQNAWSAIVNVAIESDGLIRRYSFGETIDGRFLPSIGALLEVETPAGRVGFGPVTPADVAAILEAIVSDAPHPLKLGLTEEIPWLKRQTRLTFVRCGIVDPRSLDDYRAHGGYKGLERALAMSGEGRLPAMPTVPTFTEAGMKGFGLTSVTGLVTPAKVPRAIINKINTEVNAVLALPATTEFMAKQGAEPFTSTPEQAAAVIREELARYAKIIKTGGIVYKP